MIRVIVGNNVKRDTVIVEEATTLRAVLEENNVEYARAAVNMDGATLNPGDLDKTFAELGVTDHCYLLAVVERVA